MINFADGKITAMVLEVIDDLIKVQFKDAGNILSFSPIRIVGHRLASLPILRDEDIQDI